MRAAVFPGPQEWEIVEGTTPAPAAGEALVRVYACGVCGTDAHIYRGQFPARFPLVAGHEFSGVVESVGADVSFLRPGDRVAIDPNIECGFCRPCRRGLVHLCKNLGAIGVTQDGGFATHCLLPARQCHRVPDEMPFEVAAMAEPAACCVHGIDRAGIQSGDVVVLLGAGTIGLLLLQLARLQGGGTIVVSEPNAEKREMAKRLGATTAVDPVSQDLVEVVNAASEGDGADVVIECVGGAATAEQAVSLAGGGGRVLLFGVAPEEAQITVSPYAIYRKEVSITGSFTNPFTHGRALSLLASGRLRVDGLVSHRLPLDEVRRGIELLESGDAMKVVIQTQESA